MTGVSARYIIRHDRDYHKLISVKRDIVTTDSAAPIAKEETSDINPCTTRWASWANGPMLRNKHRPLGVKLINSFGKPSEDRSGIVSGMLFLTSLAAFFGFIVRQMDYEKRYILPHGTMM